MRADESAAAPVVFAALADDTRWSILLRLGHSPASASALARELPVSRQAIAKHLAVLQGWGSWRPSVMAVRCGSSRSLRG